jgi:hypothetical protein
VTTKVQGHSSAARAKKVHQVLTHLTDKFIVSTKMGADHRKIRRKISDLHGHKVRIGHMILEKIATKLELVTQDEAEVGAKFRTNLFIACSTGEALIIGQVPSHLPRVQQEDDPKAQPTIDHHNSQKLTIHLTGNNHHSHPPKTNIRINI